MASSETLTRELEAMIGNVPGVTAMYSPEPVVAQTVKVAIGVVLDLPAKTERIAVEDTPEGVVIALHIGVGTNASAAATCRAVYDLIAETLTRQGQQIKSISVRVGRIG